MAIVKLASLEDSTLPSIELNAPLPAQYTPNSWAPTTTVTRIDDNFANGYWVYGTRSSGAATVLLAKVPRGLHLEIQG